VSSRIISTNYLFCCTTAVLLIMGICFSVPADAQVAGGTLSGTIMDPSDKFVPQAQISIVNVATGITTTVTTNSDGFYIAANLLPGEYQVTVSAKGFATEARKGISLTVGAQQVFNLTLQVGSAAKTVVEVTTEAPAVQLASSDISAVVTANTVRELPLNGRSWTDLAALQPGVSTIQTQPTFSTGADRGNRGFGQQLTISGARPQQNNYRLDGVSLNDYSNGAPGSVLGGNLGVDAIQEFSVLTSNYSAEYGKTSGGVVNAITRSGTNSFHGSIYEFLRNSALDARNYFEDPLFPKASFKRNQFGGAIGGPVIKNRTFFFADYEGVRQSKGIANTLNVPSPAARGGTVHCSADDVAKGTHGCSPTQSTYTVTVDPATQKYLALYPVPQASQCDSTKDTCPFVFNGQQVISENFFTTRIDHKFSDKDAIFGTYLYDKTPYNSPDSFGNVGLNSLSSRQILAVEETHSFTPSLVNAARFGYNHESVANNASVKAINPVAADTSLGAFPGRDASLVKVATLTDMPGGIGGLPTYFYHWNSFQGYDDAFLSKGTHSIKFGVAFEHMQLQATAFTDPNGIWAFGDLAHFLQNQPATFNAGIASTVTPRNFRQSIIGTYVQDDWRWKSSLTLNLGLRYEMATMPTETEGKLINLRNISDQFPVCGKAGPGCSGAGPLLLSNPTLHNFEPRIGFAWDPLHNGKMAVRGGIGLFDVLPLPYQFILMETQAAPYFQYASVRLPKVNPPPFPLAPPAAFDPQNAKLRSTYIESRPHRNYVTQWNLNVQYQPTPSLAALVAYVGSRGVHQPFRVDDADTALPIKTTAGYLWPEFAPTAPTMLNPRINPAYSSIRGMFYQGRSYFDALELQLAKRMSHGFQMQGTYTWGKSIDTSSATLAGDAFGNSISSLNWFDMKLTRGLSDYNVARTLVINGTWEIPTAKSWTGPAKWATDGWELGMIFTVSDGVPFTPTWGTGNDPANTLNNDDFAYLNRLSTPGCSSVTHPGEPRNYIKTECFAIPTAPDLNFWNTYCAGGPGAPDLSAPTADTTNLQCYNLRGKAGRNTIIGPGVTNLDFSVFKNNRVKRISENFNVQFRLEMFNIMNHPNFGVPGPGDGNTDIFDAFGNPQSPKVGGLAGVLQRTTIPERTIQVAVKILF
jgi:hypothetical protein